LSCVLYSAGVNMHFLQPEAYSFHFWCERALTFAKNKTFFVVIKNKQASPAQVRKSNAKVM